jgi:hypothetical protein
MKNFNAITDACVGGLDVLDRVAASKKGQA